MDLGVDLGGRRSIKRLTYGTVALVIGALIAWLVVDGREQERRLAALAARGVKRRSTTRS
jgi:heme exporter protein D